MVKVEPFIYGGEIQAYYQVGEKIADAFHVGKKLKK